MKKIYRLQFKIRGVTRKSSYGWVNGASVFYTLKRAKAAARINRLYGIDSEWRVQSSVLKWKTV